MPSFKRCNVLFFSILIFITFNVCKAQSKKFIAIIPPLHSRQELGSLQNPLQLSNQTFVLFVYPNAVAVYSESVFINQSSNFVKQEMALPSTGHDEKENDPHGSISNGILNVQLWIQGERVNPQLIQDGNVKWYTIETKFSPHQTKRIKALFWAETSLTDIDSIPGLQNQTIAKGKREFVINLAHAAIWNNKINSVNVTVVLEDSISTDPKIFRAKPSSYDLNDSTLAWSMKSIEPTQNDNIFVEYNPKNVSDANMNNMSNISHYFVKTVYDQLIYYASQLNKF